MSNRIMGLAGIVALLALALVALAPGPAAATARFQATATLSGHVLSADNLPLAGVRLAAFTQAGTTPNRQPVANIQTGADGSYSVSVPAGTIWMNVLTQDVLGQSFWGYDREPVNVDAGAMLTNQDFVIAIRVVSLPPTPLPAATPEPPLPTATPEPPVGMPSSGQPAPAPGLFLLPLLLLVGLGVVLRRRAAR